MHAHQHSRENGSAREFGNRPFDRTLFTFESVDFLAEQRENPDEENEEAIQRAARLSEIR